ncbi:aldo/keto reductase [Clostridium sp. Marseille-P3244]|uniref:aldo/keto reductase n=1 Tax=Clostridium sp. Marseille-P3244 TaxID=1871020 RepID=UPI00092FDA90|nr:aldo/keto reductase [Clostridium sp. Marseille-P3244]
MRTVNLGDMKVPAIAVGCRRINNLEKPEAELFIRTAMDLGANFFDHADLYGGMKSDARFAEAIDMKPSIREKMFIQTKCGIRPAMNAFDLSKDYILSSVDGSLKRLRTDYIDVLLIHRMDALVEPEEVAEAFGILQQSGKVRAFGVSNLNPMQIRLLQRYVKQPIVANQLQFSIAHCSMVSQGIYTNMELDSAIDRDGSILDFCRLNDITIQTWSPFQFGYMNGVFLDHPDFPELNKVLKEIAEKYSVTPTTIAMAWILRHPARMQPITGTMRIERLKECVKAAEITLTRDEWYALYTAAGNALPCKPQKNQATS